MSKTAETRPLVPKPVPGVNGIKPYPAKWRSYWELTRLHRFPMGTDLVFWPCTWGLTMAAYRTGLGPQQVAIQSLAYFVGSVLLHSAACVINDICDREFDRQVERCKNRPIASGAVSVFGATVFLLAQVGVCLWMLAYTNNLAIIVGLIGLFPFHTLYPLMKRYTNWPQAWLGIAMNWGLLTAWIGVTGSFEWSFLPHLLLGSQAWCIVYDTIYAYQDRRDDLKAGVNSTAVLFGDNGKPILSAFASVFVASLVYAGIQNEQGMPFFVISVGGCIAHFIWQFITVDLDSPKSCGAKFCANGHMGWILWAGLLVDYYLKVVA